MASASQSPRAKRDSTNDPEAYAKGEVQTTAEPIRSVDAANSAEGRDPWQYQGGVSPDTPRPSDDLKGL